MRRHDTTGRSLTAFKALVALLVVCGAGAALWLSGTALAAYRWCYVALAYPPALLVSNLRRLRHKNVTVPTWPGWMAHVGAHYAQAHQKPYTTLILLEAVALALLLAVAAWRVVWFLCTRPGRITVGATHGDAHLATPRELRALRDRGGPLLLGRLGRRG